MYRFFAVSIAVLLIGLFHSTSLHAQEVPDYQVIFDDFKYDATGYPDEPRETNLFGPNFWTDRDGESIYWGLAWYYYNWRWQFRNGTIHPNGSIELNDEWPYSVVLAADSGYTRNTAERSLVPVQMESGFSFDQGTWAVNVKLDQLENIRYFTQAFWIISPYATDANRGGVRSWVEFNHEWQNWFAVNFVPNTGGTVESLTDDIWNAQNEWVQRRGYAGPVFSSDQLPSTQQRTYLANGLRMYDLDSNSIATGETAGGIALKNPFQLNAPAFSCYRSVDGSKSDIDDPQECMDALVSDLSGNDNPWVQLMIQYDGRDVTYSAFVPTSEQGFVHMQSGARLNRRALPMKVNLGIHTPNASIVLGDNESTKLEIDWFYYSPNTDLYPWDLETDVKAFRDRAWHQVNLDGVSLEPPAARPWRIDSLKVPDEQTNAWLVVPALRETSGLEIEWNFRTRSKNALFYSEWRGWENGDFFLEVDPQPHEIEMDVRVLDHNATDHRERPRWANISCVRFNYETRVSSYCAGGPQPDSPYSEDQVPRRIELKEFYPNPVRSSSNFVFGLPQAGPVQLVVYDSLGREIQTLLDQFLGEGFHKFTWDQIDLSAGTYFYMLRQREQKISGSFTVLK